MFLHALNLVCELGVITASIINLFSERQHPDHGSDMHQEQLSIMLVSIATAVAAFLLTVIGAGSSLAGLKVVAARVSEAGARRRSARQSAAGNCVVPITNPLVSDLKHLEGGYLIMQLRSDRRIHACMMAAVCRGGLRRP